jgi:quercetin dioxygenase-like cupin family protein
MKLTTKYVVATCVTLPAFLAPVIAQQGITRAQLGTADFPPGFQTVMGIATIPANICFERHTHPGMENAYILEGEVLLKVEGQPEKRIKAGESTQIPANAPHTGCTSASGAKVLTTHVIERGKPLASPAP